MQVAKTGLRATRTPRQFDTLCNTELVIWAACCHIQYDFLYEMGISESLLHHLHQHLSLYLYLYLLSLSVPKSTSFSKSTHSFGPTPYPPGHPLFWEGKLLHSVLEISAFTAVEICMHGQVVSCHPLVWLDSQLAMSERGIWCATQIERQRKEHTRPWQ